MALLAEEGSVCEGSGLEQEKKELRKTKMTARFTKLGTAGPLGSGGFRQVCTAFASGQAPPQLGQRIRNVVRVRDRPFCGPTLL
jgi:hypothetical protein